MQNLTHFKLTIPETIEKETTISRNFFKADHFKAMIFSFAEGEELSDHSSKKQAVLHVLSGTGLFETETESIQLEVNTWISIPAGKVHCVKADKTLHFLLYIIG